ncbi:tryptophan synthase subunit alpha [Magnetofaba australis]|uniref:Tryptophan synthase alpha chain n=1 Tax=Magnetofaba australis IT-1 TaxID=1434232 RepID=A0A1Y2K7S6_9PROT|nr:tryptophan synthase subunit alpha [Magnetofaba australis]OSM06793.1 putative tryptophan synthase subunit alpha [Magnetofaba australis IT-1]
MSAAAHTSAIEPIIREKLSEKPILLMAHLVLGYPSIEENKKVIAQMVDAGVDLIELQIPFSEPIADGPVIAQANQAAIDAGFRVDAGLEAIAEITLTHDIPFLIMTYVNILHARGMGQFISDAAKAGVKGLIVPDLPLQEAGEAIAWSREAGLDWIQLMTPTSHDDRLAAIGAEADGFVYCVARRGVTGKNTSFDDSVGAFVTRCRAATKAPLAVGFGVKNAEDVAYLQGKAEIAVVGTAAIAAHREGGAEAVGRFFRGLRPAD